MIKASLQIIFLSMLFLIPSCDISDLASTDGSDSTSSASETSTDASSIRNSIVETAKSYIGTPYYYGGSSPETGFDCSGFVQYCFKKNGVTLPRTSKEQSASGTAVEYKDAKAADVLCFYSPVSHVGLYLGKDEFIHSPSTGKTVSIESMIGYYEEHLTAVRSYITSE